MAPLGTASASTLPLISDALNPLQSGVGMAGRGEKASANPINGWKGFEEVMKSITGESVDEVQAGPSDIPTGAQGSIVPLGKSHHEYPLPFIDFLAYH